MSNQLLIGFVELHAGQPMTNTRLIGQRFGKRHDNVMRDVREAQEKLNKIMEPNFEGEENQGVTPYQIIEDTYPDADGVPRPMYWLNESFTVFLVMGFTGEEALRVKHGFIQAFYQMRRQLEEGQTPAPVRRGGLDWPRELMPEGLLGPQLGAFHVFIQDRGLAQDSSLAQRFLRESLMMYQAKIRMMQTYDALVGQVSKDNGVKAQIRDWLGGGKKSLPEPPSFGHGAE